MWGCLKNVMTVPCVDFLSKLLLFNPCITNQKKLFTSKRIKRSNFVRLLKKCYEGTMRVNIFFWFVVNGLKSANFDGKSPTELPACQYDKSGDFHKNAPLPLNKIENSLKKGHFEKKMFFLVLNNFFYKSWIVGLH